MAKLKSDELIKRISKSVIFATVGILLIVNFMPTLFSVTLKDVERENDDPGWIRLAYAKGGKTVTVTVDNGITISGDDVQTGDGDTIIWADGYLAVFVKDGVPQYIGKNNSTQSGTLNSTFTISRNNIRTQLIDGPDTYTFPSSQYAMMPSATGEYSSFIDGDSARMDDPKRTNNYIGGIMGITTYNNMNDSIYDLYMTVIKEDGSVKGAEWRETA